MNHRTTLTRSRLLVTAVASCAAVAAVAVTAGPATGAPPGGDGVSLPFFGPIEGPNGAEGTFAGAITEPVFANEDGTLTLTAVLDGVVDVDGTTVRVEGEELTTPVEPSVVGSVEAAEAGGTPGSEAGDTAATTPTSESGGTSASEPGGFRGTGPEPDPDKCDVLFLDIQPITLNLLGLEVLTSRITVDANAIPGEGNLAGNLLCSLAGLLDGLPDTLDDVTDQLNQLVEQAGTEAASLAGSLPVSWPVEGADGEAGTFTGTVSDVVFSEGDDVLLDGVLNGIVDTGGEAVRLVDEPLSSPVAPSVVGAIPGEEFTGGTPAPDSSAAPTTQPETSTAGTTQPTSDPDNPTQPEPDPDKCDVLYLDIQPITLNLLGLEVLTSRITVDVNAIPGEGNLAGNLVCALAGLLDGTPDAIGEITDQLNQVVDEIGATSAAPTSVPETGDTVTGATETPTDSVSEPDATTAGTEAAEEPTPTEAPSEPTEPPSTDAPSATTTG